MSIFSKNNKKKIALALACASVLSGKSSLAAQNKGEQCLAGKAIAGTFLALFSLEAIHSIIGVATNSELGEYSIGRVIKLLVYKEKATRVKIAGIMNDFLPIIEIIKSDEYKNAVKKQHVEEVENGLGLMPFYAEIFKQVAKNKNIDLAELLSRVIIDEPKREKQEEESDEDYKTRILLSSSGLPEFQRILGVLSDEEQSKKAKEQNNKIKYASNGIVIDSKYGKISFTVNNDGSLTLANEEDGEVKLGFTLTPLRKK